MLIFDVGMEDVRNALESSKLIPPNGQQQIGTTNAPEKTTTKSLIDFANFSSIPRVFKNAESHPKNTNLLCWHCGRPFSKIPRFIALESYHSESQPNTLEWLIEGNFCTWACAAKYINIYYSEPKKWALLQNLAVVRAQCDGGKIRLVKPAPDRNVICLYSGSAGMTQQEFIDIVENLSVA
jgi:hypothetical protein